MNINDQSPVSADLYSNGTKEATVKVPATDSFPTENIISYDGRLFVLRSNLNASDAGPASPNIYDEVKPYKVPDA